MRPANVTANIVLIYRERYNEPELLRYLKSLPDFQTLENDICIARDEGVEINFHKPGKIIGLQAYVLDIAKPDFGTHFSKILNVMERLKVSTGLTVVKYGFNFLYIADGITIEKLTESEILKPKFIPTNRFHNEETIYKVGHQNAIGFAKTFRFFSSELNLNDFYVQISGNYDYLGEANRTKDLLVDFLSRGEAIFESEKIFANIKAEFPKSYDEFMNIALEALKDA